MPGHMSNVCTKNRKIDDSGIKDMTPEEAWAALKAADAEQDLDDIRDVCSKRRVWMGKQTHRQ